MTKIEWERLYNLLVKNHEQVQKAYHDSLKGKTYKTRKLGERNTNYALGRVEYYIDSQEASRLLLEEYLNEKAINIKEFFQPVHFLNNMNGFLRKIDIIYSGATDTAAF